MIDSGAPTKIPAIWANAASSPYINNIPTPSQQTIKNGAASFADGFPPNCFVPLATGGAGPFGGDFNGLLQQVTAGLQWAQAGGPLPFDATWAAATGGYPKKAIISSIATAGLFWISTLDNNQNNPDTGGAGWLAFTIPSVSPVGAYVNKFRNASNTVTQRNLPITVASGGIGAYTLDGWIVNSTGASLTVSQGTALTGALSPNSLSIVGAVGASAVNLIQVIESFDAFSLASQTVTYQAKIYNNTGSPFIPHLTVKTAGAADTWSTSNTVVAAQALQTCAAGTVTLVNFPIAMPASAVYGVSVTLAFGAALNGTGFAVQVADADLRVGPGVVLPEIRPIFAELLQCQRYFFAGALSGNIGVAVLESTTQMFLQVAFPVAMRTGGPTGLSYRALSDFQIGYSGVTYNPTALIFHNSYPSGAVAELTDSAHTYTINTAASIALAGAPAYLWFTGCELSGTAI